jgi:3-deoxy-D-manno-octulosonate 8-phosphate phosphatase (KDO 8-P phosphatase)
VIQGVKDKAVALRDYMNEHNLNGDRFAYVGDDLNDYTAMQMCGFKACPADAAEEIRNICDFVSTKKGGHGAVREFCDHLLQKQEQYDDMLKLFGVEP